MKLHPLFKWFGSKWQSAKRYPPPEHEYLIEPFAGGAGYALNHSERSVILWEEDPNLVELWEWIIESATEDEIRQIPIGVSSGTDIRELGLNHGQELLLKHWQRTNNVGDCWTISPWGHLPGQWTENTRARVAEEIGGVKHWEVREPILYVDVPATWFVDPPYLYNYRYRRDLKPFDYSALDSFIQTIDRRSLVICCEARHPKTGEVPAYLPFEASHESVTSRRKETQSHHSKELVFIHRPDTLIR